MSNFANPTIWTGDVLDILRGLKSALVNLIPLVTGGIQPFLTAPRPVSSEAPSVGKGLALKLVGLRRLD